MGSEIIPAPSERRRHFVRIQLKRRIEQKQGEEGGSYNF